MAIELAGKFRSLLIFERSEEEKNKLRAEVENAMEHPVLIQL